VKLNNTYILFDSGKTADREDWAKAHAAVSTAIRAMRWPDNETAESFRIPRIVTIRRNETYTDEKGSAKTVTRPEGKTLRNGVRPLRDQFRRRLVSAEWRAEQPMELSEYFGKLRKAGLLTSFVKYPAATEIIKDELLNENVGDFDFWFKTRNGFRTVVEWETGNISSSHRSLNKMCLALMGDLADAAVLIVPSTKLYPHLTDRIGNIRELQPYFYFWRMVGTLSKAGLLCVIEVEHDELFDSKDCREFVPTGSDGNSRRSKKAKRGSPPKKRSPKKR